MANTDLTQLFGKKGFVPTVEIQNKDGFDPIPAGEYVAVITAASLEPNPNGGDVIYVEFTIADGRFKNRKLWGRYQVSGGSEKALKFGQGMVLRIQNVLEIEKLTTLNYFLNREIVLFVKLEKSEYKSQQSGFDVFENKISSFGKVKSPSKPETAQSDAAEDDSFEDDTPW